ncbi:MAG: hypothetical protein JNM93_12960 [Bacteriovoracaceae bacterium]|nr:hypothetical protein [Bacteriovoracaceae bacterium]
MRFLIFVSLLTLFACREYASLEEAKGVAYIKDFSSKIERIDVQEWKVGSFRSKVVHSGILVAVSVTPLSEVDAQKVIKTYGIDSVIMRVQKINNTTPEDIGYSYIPFFTSNARTGRSFVEIVQITFKINYSAAVSGSLRRYQCPAHNHRAIMTDYEIRSLNFGKATLKTTPIRDVRKVVERNQLMPPVFNGGASLTGDYRVEVALYDSVKKKVFGDWVSSDGIVKIGHEKLVEMPECAGVHEEFENGVPKKKFKF